MHTYIMMSWWYDEKSFIGTVVNVLQQFFEKLVENIYLLYIQI